MNEIITTPGKADALYEAAKKVTKNTVRIEYINDDWKINCASIGPCTAREAVKVINMVAPMIDIVAALSTYPVKLNKEAEYSSEECKDYIPKFAKAIKRYDVNEIIELMK